MEKFAPCWGTLLGNNTFILWGGERMEKERGVAALFFSFKNKGRSGGSSNLSLAKWKKSIPYSSWCSHAIPGPSSAFTALALRRCQCPRLLTSQPDGVWAARGFSSFPGSGRRETSAACRSPAGCAGEREGQRCSQGRDDPGHRALPLQTLRPTQGRACRGLRLTQTGCWHGSPLSQGKKSAATLEQGRSENRDTEHRVCFHWLWLLGMGYQQPLVPERSLLGRYLQRHLQRSTGRHLNEWKINLQNGISHSLEHSKSASCSFQHLN